MPAAIKDSFDGMKADEPRGAGDEYFHFVYGAGNAMAGPRARFASKYKRSARLRNPFAARECKMP